MHGSGVFAPKIDRPYFDAWLRRTGRQFAVSGRLTETAMALAASEGGTVDFSKQEDPPHNGSTRPLRS